MCVSAAKVRDNGTEAVRVQGCGAGLGVQGCRTVGLGLEGTTQSLQVLVLCILKMNVIV